MKKVSAIKDNKTDKYDHKEIESKWQKIWAANKTYSPNLTGSKNPFYNLMMFPYASAEGLHVGNMYAFTGADVYGRFKRMNGYDVFEPIGLDGFGIHSENYAIKVGRHPKDHARLSEEHFYRQLHMIGNGFDWDHKLETYDPQYYKWTQWLFIKMFKSGLAYKKAAMVNWCPSCKTVLADEQVVTPSQIGKEAKNADGSTIENSLHNKDLSVCERCATVVQRREMSSWFFKITDYADRLLDNIEKIDWPDRIKIAQRQWIGKSKGLTIEFKISDPNSKDPKLKIPVWTKFWETVYGVTFIVVSPEYARDHLIELIPEERKKEVEKYVKISLNKSEQDRKAIREKSGVLMGIAAENPVNGESVPVFVADYVLANVGTGAVMGVPAHDERDFAFAKKYDLKIIQVVSYEDKDLDEKVKNGQLASEMGGKIVNSDAFDGLDSRGIGKEKMAEWMIGKKFARWEINYHLRDWLISRQRYWGPPIPMINCPECGWQSVPEEDLPVVLPDIKDFKPQGDGTSPLHNAPDSWKSVKCPNCGTKASRELDVSDTFLDSSWYFLRYPTTGSADSAKVPFNKEITQKWLPVDAYIGGAEHAVLHLLYARFVWMFLRDQGFLDFPASNASRSDAGWEEPFPFLFGHGLIIKDGAKMSKSKGNIVNPDEYIEKYGADTLRTYLMFLGPFDQGGDFRDTGIEGMNRFLQRVWRLFADAKIQENGQLASETYAFLHKTIKKVTEDLGSFKYNTAISGIMELVNYLTDSGNLTLTREPFEVLTKLIAPFAPHLAEEIWQTKFVTARKKFDSIHRSSWPNYDERYLQSDKVKLIVQVNGKLRATFEADTNKMSDKEYLVSEAKKLENVSKWIKGGTKKEIYVPGKLINFVI